MKHRKKNKQFSQLVVFREFRNEKITFQLIKNNRYWSVLWLTVSEFIALNHVHKLFKVRLKYENH